MKPRDHSFWPCTPKVSIITAVVVLLVLLLLTGVLRVYTGWPADSANNTVLIGIFILSLLPIVLAILNVVIERGGSIGYGDLKIDFSKIQQLSNSGFTVPANIGVRGQYVADSGTSNILETLRAATSSGVAVIDLEDGHAWWETRLLVLLAGADRLKKPDKIVFVATAEAREQTYLGWARPGDLLEQLLKEDPRYLRTFYAARAAAAQWALLGPLALLPPGSYYNAPPPPPWMQGILALSHAWMAFSTTTGLPNELLTEQLLQNELGQIIESTGGAKHISTVHLDSLFKPVLIKKQIDKNWDNEQQTNALFANEDPFIVITESGKYSAIVSAQSLYNEVLRGFLKTA
ncbi:hypothetical protein DIU31_003710 [Mucilaginibacter rubeus]|uniref:Uncharacterized protein n=1 Tax=Mucilaginibacter rubeus TaxID=2027860 RepID=A0AAE6JBW3_9SPHI|nr:MULTISPECIES: hypothetical protein [Mucilaginibacter]QEM02666.1 hypothetical protein DIU31_003710 [Mucilaginibacter rubeus]QEM15286.1 hypothetical protein DIU38_003745 [Mucilaginibacter gossypii]QTE41985.1 hypothetical protein J3L19_24045 [Mucilaginibacter rubeus]QTE48586.1 hypothetical protein J3L21_24025 [Mucilaginibacter rubeus]QTE59973.1 hypothetical protein J3L23_15660 [Mucilaginibacter rubeus]